MSVESARKSETTEKHGEQKLDCNVNRYIILEKTFNCGEWCEAKAKQKRCVGPVKIQAMKAAVYAYFVTLQGLRDVELDVLMKEIQRIKEHIGMKT